MELFASVLRVFLEFGAFLAVAWILRHLATRLNRTVQRRAQGWPTAAGSVEWATPKMVGDGRAAFWVGEITYSYSVAGEYYSGVFQAPVSSEDEAWKAVEGWKGRSITVRYSPSDASKSVLVIDEQGVSLVSGAIG